MKTDEKKIVFIICVNDEEEYTECRYYLNDLRVPEGYTVDVLKIEGAPSMAAGYNVGMKNSDAKYKVYMHQDVFIINENFIEDILKIFASDRQIGLLGMVGNRDIGTTAFDVQIWDLGAIIDCRMPWKSPISSKEEIVSEAQAVDGLLIATQYDLPWREDIFDGWHFYDISQCMEFKKAGYKVAVPWQENPWCDHDNLPCGIIAYYDYYELFVDEYAELTEIPKKRGDKLPSYEKEKEYMLLLETIKNELEQLITLGTLEARIQLRNLFRDFNIQGTFEVMEYESIACIDETEECNQSELKLWDEGMSAAELVLKWRALKYALKRIAYKEDNCLMRNWVWKNYSRYAVEDVCFRYSLALDRVLR